MHTRSLTIATLSASVFVGSVLAATTEPFALEDPLNPLWQQSAGSGTITIFNPNASLTFQQIAWMFGRYDHFIIQPLRDKIEQPKSASGSTMSGTSSLAPCDEHQTGDTYAAADRCNMCICTAKGAVCTTNACAEDSSMSSESSKSTATSFSSASTQSKAGASSSSASSSSLLKGTCTTFMQDGQSMTECSI